MFTHGGGAVVTTAAGTDHGSVVHPADRAEAAGAMAGITAVTGVDMIGRLADGTGTVMTARTAVGNTTVVKHCTRPAAGGVTFVTAVGGLDMVKRFTHGRGAVVTTAAGTDHGCVIDAADVSCDALFACQVIRVTEGLAVAIRAHSCDLAGITSGRWSVRYKHQSVESKSRINIYLSPSY